MPVIFSRGDKLGQGHFTVTKELGVGGMGVVYQCRDEHLLRDVAIKMLLPELMANKSSVEIFRQEARLAAKLEHPNIVTVYEIGVEERQGKQHHYVSMEYLPGGNLANRVLGGPLAIEHCLNWMKQLASGLTFAHKYGVIHQDIKADNIFITNEGDLKIGDFGLARLFVGRVHYNTSTKGMGTPAYMSPELCRGEPQDHRSDIYSLGILFFEMATGQLPYRARGMIEMATKHSSAPIPSSRRINPLIPEVLDKVIKRMMSKTPDERYNSMSEVLTILDDLIFEMRVARLGIGGRPVLRSGPVSVESSGPKTTGRDGEKTHSVSQTPGDKSWEGQAAKQGTKPSTSHQSEKIISQLEKSVGQLARAKEATRIAEEEKKALPLARKSQPGVPAAQSASEASSLLLKPKLELEWCFETSGPIGWTSAPIVDKEDQTLFVASSDGNLYAVEIASGKARWRCKTGNALLASPVLLSDKVLVANTAGKVQAISAKSGDIIWQHDLKESVVSTPAIGRDVLFVPTNEGWLWALDCETGKVRWKFNAGHAIVCAPNRHGELILFGTKGGAFHALSVSDGESVWRFRAGSPIVASSSTSVDSVYFGTQAGEFYALEAASGGLIWEYSTEGAIVSRAVIAFTSVIFCSYDKWLYCCEKYDGGLKWKAAVHGKVMASLVVNKETLLAATHEGWLQAFHTKNGALLWQRNFERCLESPPVLAAERLFQATVEGEVLAYKINNVDAVIEKSA